MLVYREEGQSHEEDAFETLDVDLQKKSGRGLGLTIVGRKNGPGVFISEVVSMFYKHLSFWERTMSAGGGGGAEEGYCLSLDFGI